MTYLGEFRINWRTMAAAVVGMGTGYILYLYLQSLFAPHLIKEFGWSKSQFALITSTTLISLITLPIYGRLTDRYGTKRIGAIGIVSYPLIFLAFAFFQGGFALFYLLNLALMALVAGTTSSALYSRIIANRFHRARGLALSLIASIPPAISAVMAPLLSALIEEQGWRAGYLALAGLTTVTGAIVLLMMPGDVPATRADPAARVGGDYRTILASPSFRIIMTGIFLVCIASLALPAQLKLILIDREAGAAEAALMVSFFSGGIAVGRLICGAALDRYRPEIVAAITLGVPSVGLFLLATGATHYWLLAGSVGMVGLAMGAELDIATYLVMRWFRPEIYSSVYGLIAAGTALSGVGGSLLLSLTLKLSGGFDLYLYICAVAMAAGAASFLLLGRHPTVN
jgi:MFS family permease